MAYTDLTVDNGWIPVQYTKEVLAKDVQVSAVEAVGRKIKMTSDLVKVPTFDANGVDVVAEGALIPLKDATLDDLTLDAHKWANRYAQSVEDEADSVADFFEEARNGWLSDFAISFDNAALGVTGTGGPYESVYRAVGSGRRLATAGALTYEDVASVFGDMLTARKGGLVVIAHPSVAMSLRNLKDENGDRVVDTSGVLSGGVPTLFGHEVRFSFGARTSAAFSSNPSGNPLVVVAAKNELIVGQRSGPEVKFSEGAQWENDVLEMKLRARRGFVLASAGSARVIEITPSA